MNQDILTDIIAHKRKEIAIQEAAEMGVVYTDMESALKGEYADMVRTHFMMMITLMFHQ